MHSLEVDMAYLPWICKSAIEYLLLHVINSFMEEQSIGDRIRELRQKLKYTQVDVAKGTGIPQSNLSEFETGKLHPTMVTLKKLALFFGVSLSHLFGDDTGSIDSLKLNVRMTNQLSSDGKKEILDFIDMVWKKEEECKQDLEQ